MHEPGADRAYQNFLPVCPQGERDEQEAPIITTGTNGQEPFFSGRMRGIGIDSWRLGEQRLDLCPCNPVLPAFGPVALIPFESSDPDVLHFRRLHVCTYIHKQLEGCREPVCDAGRRGSRAGAVGTAGEEVMPARGVAGKRVERSCGMRGLLPWNVVSRYGRFCPLIDIQCTAGIFWKHERTRRDRMGRREESTVAG